MTVGTFSWPRTLAGSTLLPGEPWASMYVINSDGTLIARDRCVDDLVAMEVRWETDSGESSESWNAAAEKPGVVEFWLFRSGQPGVTVTSSEIPPEAFIGDLYVTVTDARGYEGYLGFPARELQPGTVAWHATSRRVTVSSACRTGTSDADPH